MIFSADSLDSGGGGNAEGCVYGNISSIPFQHATTLVVCADTPLASEKPGGVLAQVLYGRTHLG